MVGERGVVAQTPSVVPKAPCDPGGPPRRCPHCGGGKLGQWGNGDNGVQRLRCGACERTFAVLHGTVLAGLHDIAAFRRVLDDMMGEGHSSCRALAARLGLDKSTVWRWRMRINAVLARGDRERVRCLVDGEAVPLRESRKASREWVNHRQDPARFPAPDRPRWVDVDRGRLPPPVPLERYLVSVHVAEDGAGRGIARVLPADAVALAGIGTRRSAPGVASTSASITAESTPPAGAPFDQVPTHGPATAAGANEPGAPAAAMAANGHRVASCLRERFKSFIRPFRGPATRHLEGYAAWFTIGTDGSKERRLATAWNLLLRGMPTGFADISDHGADAAGALGYVTGGETGGWVTG